jgi:hypothetical protein
LSGSQIKAPGSAGGYLLAKYTLSFPETVQKKHRYYGGWIFLNPERIDHRGYQFALVPSRQLSFPRHWGRMLAALMVGVVGWL